MGLAARQPPDPDGEGQKGTYTFGPPGHAGLSRPGPKLEKALGWSRLQAGRGGGGVSDLARMAWCPGDMAKVTASRGLSCASQGQMALW